MSDAIEFYFINFIVDILSRKCWVRYTVSFRPRLTIGMIEWNDLQLINSFEGDSRGEPRGLLFGCVIY